MTVDVGGCHSNTTDPTPSTLIVVELIPISQITVTTVDGLQTANLPWFSGIPVGDYRIDFVSGFIPWYVSSDLSCLPVTTDAVGDGTGTHGADVISAGMVFHSIPHGNDVQATIAGLACGFCGLVDSCDTAALQVNTLATNPVATFEVDSPTFGSGGGNVASCPSVGVGTGGFGVFRGSGSITWSISSTRHVYDQPSCVKITDFASVKSALGNCPACTTPAIFCAARPLNCTGPTSEWDGTFPFRKVFFPTPENGRVAYYADDIDLPNIDILHFTLNGSALATNFPGIYTGITYRSVAGVGWWELRIICYMDPASGFIQAVWLGKKMTGTDPTGPYQLDHTSDACATGPETICIQPC